MEKKEVQIKNAWVDFSTLEYERKLEERALYPFATLNYLTGGMELGEMSIIAGETGGGKTTFISQTVQGMIADDSVGCIYGEGTLRKQQLNTYRQMTPYSKESYQYLQYFKNGRKTNIGGYFVNQESEKKIKEVTKKKLFYYDTAYGMTVPKILEAIDFANSKGGIKYFLVDNLTQVETATENEVKELKDGMEIFRRYTIDKNVHIALIAHYRKAQDMQLIRRNLQEIMGTSATGQKGATVLNIMRMDNIDKSLKSYKNLKEIVRLNNYDLDEADGLIEILKTRHNKLGFVALKHNNASNTFYECKKIDDKKEETEKVIVQSSKKESSANRSIFETLVEIEDDGSLPF